MIHLLFMVLEIIILVGLKKEISNLLSQWISPLWKFILIFKIIHMFNGYFNYNHIKWKFTSSNPVKSKPKRKIHKTLKNSNQDFINNKGNIFILSIKLWLKTIKLILSNQNFLQDKRKTIRQCNKWDQKHSIRIRIGGRIWIRTSLALVMTLNKFHKLPCNKKYNNVSKICNKNHIWRINLKWILRIKVILKKEINMKFNKGILRVEG